MERASHGKQSVLHITPHLGGGVGRVLLNYLAAQVGSSGFSHSVLCLEYANERALAAARTSGFSLREKMAEHHAELLEAISDADVVLVHWWNHPLLNALLVRETLPACRLIFWSHVSGLYPPQVFNDPALAYPDVFVLTTPASLEAPEIRRMPQAKRDGLRVVWSTGGVEHVADIAPKPHAGFKIGYIGTVDYGKMHPAFLEMCSQVALPDAEFIVCGGPSHDRLREQARSYDGNFTFTGHVSNINDYLSEFDVFGYPLAPYHYGTCEQALGEAMAAGVPPVVLANLAESFIVEDGVSGIVAKNARAYARALEDLYHQPELRKRLSEGARAAAHRRFSMTQLVRHWDAVYTETLTTPKLPKRWGGRASGPGVTAAELLIEALGDHAEPFARSLAAVAPTEDAAAIDALRALWSASHQWRSATGGTPQHYHRFFGDDELLRRWAEAMR